jgi:hypothetical protein
MTDLDKFIALFQSVGIDIKPTKSDTGFSITLGDADEHPYTSDKVKGYTGFYTAIEFDPEGKFISMGAWE